MCDNKHHFAKSRAGAQQSHTLTIVERFSTFEQEGYKSRHHASSHTQGKGPTEDPEEDAQRLQHGHDFKGVAVIPLRLIGHNGPVGMSQAHAITQH